MSRTDAAVLLGTPHIAVGTTLVDGMLALRSIGGDIHEEQSGERCLKVIAPGFRVAIYPKGEFVGSVWYDDPLGRESAEGIRIKVERYLERYGPMSNWEQRMENGWMQYWFNPRNRVAMVYGIHKDVIRFNQFDDSA
jgi:hypothetical protein